MSSPVNWALLGLIIERPSYGYELAQRFERVYGEVLPVSSASHIYAALNALETRSLVEHVPPSAALQSGGRQPKPHYRATAHAHRAYREWLVVQIQDDRRRSRLFARELAVLASEPDAALEVLRGYELACLEEAARTPITPPGGAARDTNAVIARLVAEENRLAGEAMLAWVEYARRELSALEAGDGGRR